MIKKFASFFLYLLPFFATAQQNIGIGTGTPNSNAILDITATNKGLLLPRLALTATNATSPLSAFVAGMAVYNTATAGVSPNNVTPGYYFSDGSKWVRLITAADAGTLSWSLGGNAGTDPSTHFFGTIDDKDLVFKRNNLRSGLINASLKNTSWGAEALNPATTGSFNTANGYQTMLNNAGGSSNSAVGNETLLNNVIGNFNTAMGDGALKTANTSHNTAIGQKAMNVTSTGNGNTGIGSRVLIANMDRAANVAAGYEALGGNISGNNNTATGSYALKLNTTGSNNAAYGYQADVLSANLNNATAIGADAKVGLSNSIVLGDSTNNVKVGIGTGYPTTAKLVIKTAAGTNGIDLASSDAYAEMRVIRNTLGIDKNLYLGFSSLPGSAIHLYSEGLTPTMTITGGNVNINGTIINEAFQIPTLLNSWVNFGAAEATPGYYKDKEGRVHLKGTIKGGTSALLFFLPPGYRPVGMLNFIVDNNFAPLTLRVGNDGGVTLGSGYNNSALSLNGVSFRAEQ